MNNAIEQFLMRLKNNEGESGPGTGSWGTEFAWLKQEDYEKFQLAPRIASKEQLTVKIMRAPWVQSTTSNEMIVRLDKPQASCQ